MQKPIFNKKSHIDSILRVDHAGEFGAVQIYLGQIKNLNSDVIEHMYDQEKVHFQYFNNEVLNRNVRPTLFLPIWRLGGYMLGYVSSKLGIKQSMVVTEAVEEVIDKHYEEQLINLDSNDEKDLKVQIKKFQADEVEHKEIAKEYANQNMNSKDKFLYLITKSICKVAIFLSKKI